MKKKTRGKSRKRRIRPLFLLLFSSYLFFLAVPLATVQIYFQRKVVGNVRAQVSDALRQSISVMKTDVEWEINDIYTEIIKLNFSSNIQAFTSMDLDTHPYDGEYIYKIKDVISELSYIKNIYPLIDSIYYLNEGKGCMLSTGTNQSYIRGADYENRLYPPLIRATKFTVTQEMNDNGENIITLICPIRQYLKGMGEYVVVDIPMKALYNRMLQTTHPMSGTTFILSNEGSMIVHSTDEPYRELVEESKYLEKILENSSQEGYFEHSSESGQLITSYVKSDTLPWVYVNVQPFDMIYNQVIAMDFMMLAITVVLFVFGAILSYALSRQIYKPVAGIMDTLRDRLDHVKGSGQNELVVLSKVFDEMVSNEARFSKIIKSKEDDLQKAHLLRVLNDPEYSEKEAPIEGNQFVCLVLSIDRYAEFTNIYDKEKQKQLYYMFFRTCEETIGQYAQSTGVHLDNGKICFVIGSFQQESVNVYEMINEIHRQLKAELSAVNFFSFSIGAGEVYNDPKHIRMSYQEALEALQYRLIYGHDCLVYYFQIQDRRGALYYPEHQIRRITNHLKDSDYKGIKQELAALTEQLQSNQKISYDNIIYIFHQLSGEIASFALRCGINPSDIFDEDNDIFSSISNKETLEQIQLWILEQFNNLIEYRTLSEEGKRQYFDRIIGIIRKNYDKSDLDINYVAMELNMSYSYVRKKFSEYCDISFVDFVNGIRIEEAKRLILTTDLTMNDIMGMTGFNNYQTFNRVFKKNEGVTPGRYRTIRKQ